jgi:hypothetical protein
MSKDAGLWGLVSSVTASAGALWEDLTNVVAPPPPIAPPAVGAGAGVTDGTPLVSDFQEDALRTRFP